jgi:hypothetical protein
VTALSSPALGGLPPTLRTELLTALSNITVNFRENKWEPSELNGGKLCEVVFSIVRGQADGVFPSRAAKPRNMVAACLALEQETQLPRSLRIQIPRMIVALYEIRNNRGVGHVGGDVDPNHMDAVAVLYMAKWLVAELIRVFHDVDTTDATEAVDALLDRELQLVWRVSGKKRVLAERMSLREKTLVLLYSEAGAVGEDDLRDWVEARNPSAYRRDVLRKLHQEKLVEYDQPARTVRLSPKGAARTERDLLVATY